MVADVGTNTPGSPAVRDWTEGNVFNRDTKVLQCSQRLLTRRCWQVVEEAGLADLAASG
jgi:hypothetical protein